MPVDPVSSGQTRGARVRGGVCARPLWCILLLSLRSKVLKGEDWLSSFVFQHVPLTTAATQEPSLGGR